MTTATKDFYRQHTFAERGPSGPETKAYLRSLSILMPNPPGSQPLAKGDMDRYFLQQRAERFPAQIRAEQDRRTVQAMKKHRQEQAEQAKR